MVLIIEKKYVLCQVTCEIEEKADDRNLQIQRDKHLAVSETIVTDFATMQSIRTKRKGGSDKLASSAFSLNVYTDLSLGVTNNESARTVPLS
jgi:hypothetical protein